MTYIRTAMIALARAAAPARFLLTFAALFGFLAGGSWLLIWVLGWGWPWWTYWPIAALQALYVAYKIQFDASGSEQPTPDQAGEPPSYMAAFPAAREAALAESAQLDLDEKPAHLVVHTEVEEAARANAPGQTDTIADKLTKAMAWVMAWLTAFGLPAGVVWLVLDRLGLDWPAWIYLLPCAVFATWGIQQRHR